MTREDGLLEKHPDELRELLLRHARNDRPPPGATQRALARVASASLGAGLLVSAKAAAGSVAPVTPWLFGKWVLIGMGTTLLALGAGTQIEGALNDERAEKPAVSSAPRSKPPALSARGVLAAEAVADPSIASSTSPSLSAGAAPEGARVRLSPQPALPANATNATPVAEALATRPGEAATASLTREVAMLKTARAALAASAAATALQTLAEYSREFPAGALRAEAAALEIEGAARLGDRARVSARAAEFLHTHPSSPLVGRVRALATGAH